jgi:hypothetical protein
MKQQRRSLQSLQAKIRQYKRNFGTIHDTPSEKLPKDCCKGRRYVAWQRTYEIYFNKFGAIDGKSWREKKEWLSILDSLLTKVVRKKSEACVVCGRIPKNCKDSQASHLLPKSVYPGLRYELDNVVHMCNDCHKNFWHKNPIEAYQWIIGKYPNRIGRLLEMKDKTTYNIKEFNEKQIYFQKILENA